MSSALSFLLLYLSASTSASLNPSPEPPIAITLHSDFHRIALYEALPVLVRIRNISDSAIEVDPRAFIEPDVGSFHITRPGGPVTVLQWPQYGEHPFYFRRPMRKINPGESIEYRFNLCCNWGGRRYAGL